MKSRFYAKIAKDAKTLWMSPDTIARRNAIIGLPFTDCERQSKLRRLQL
jgi:hypothetical protein